MIIDINLDSKAADVCIQHEFCTDCPARIGCSIRRSFYDDEKYHKSAQTSGIATLQYAASRGIAFLDAAEQMKKTAITMNSKRKHELEQYPTYSTK